MLDQEDRTQFVETQGELKSPGILRVYVSVNQTVIQTGLGVLGAQPSPLPPGRKTSQLGCESVVLLEFSCAP